MHTRCPGSEWSLTSPIQVYQPRSQHWVPNRYHHVSPCVCPVGQTFKAVSNTFTLVPFGKHKIYWQMKSRSQKRKQYYPKRIPLQVPSRLCTFTATGIACPASCRVARWTWAIPRRPMRVLCVCFFLNSCKGGFPILSGALVS